MASLLTAPASVYDPLPELPEEIENGGLEPDGRVTLGQILDTMITSLEDLGLEPVPGSVGAAGFTVLVRGHKLRIGFGVTMS